MRFTENPTVAARRRLAAEGGFSLIEAVMAMALFVGVATALAGLLVSSIASYDLARERTIAKQVAMKQIEEIRQMPYAQVGTSPGNPPGTLPPTVDVSGQLGLDATMTLQITYVNDPIPTSYQTGANYKKVVVVVARDSDGKVLAREVTNVSPPTRAAVGGINKGVINIRVTDLKTDDSMPNLTVQLRDGPAGNDRDGVTDESGEVTFAALDPNPTTGPTAYYNVTVVPPAGYVVNPDLSATQLQLDPSEIIGPKVIQVYKPATIDVTLKNADGTTYTGNADVTVSSTYGSATYPVSGGTLTVSNLKPASDYTIYALKPNGVSAEAVAQTVPEDYPTVMTKSFVLTFPPIGSVTVNVTWGGDNVPGATVTLTDGASVNLTATTDAGGNATFTGVPAGTGYTVSASISTVDGDGSATTTGLVVDDQTVTPVSLGFATGTLTGTATLDGSPLAGATITVTGGPMGVTRTATTLANGDWSLPSLPAGTGYTITVSKPGTTDGAATTSGVAVTTGSNPPVVQAFGTLRVQVESTGSALGSATVAVAGPASASKLTNASGIADFVLPVGTGYSATASKSGVTDASASTSGLSVVSGSLTSASLAFGTIRARVLWATLPVSGATVSVTGVAGTKASDSNGYADFVVPVGSGYSASASKPSAGGSSSSTAVGAVTNSATPTAVTLAFTQTKTLTLTLKRGTTNIPNTNVSVSITDGPNGAANANPAHQYFGLTNGSSQVVFTVPYASTGSFRVKAYLTGCPGSSNRSRSMTVSAAQGTTSATVSLNTSTCPLTFP